MTYFSHRSPEVQLLNNAIRDQDFFWIFCSFAFPLRACCFMVVMWLLELICSQSRKRKGKGQVHRYLSSGKQKLCPEPTQQTSVQSPVQKWVTDPPPLGARKVGNQERD